MSTTIFPGNTAGIVYEGGTYNGSQFNTPNFFGGEYIQQTVGTNAKLRVNFTGTDCDLYAYADGGTWGWTIDGGSLQTASPSGGNMQWLNVATGLSDTTHTLVLVNIRYFVGWDKILRVTGAAPALSAPTGYTYPQFGFPSSGVTRDGSQYFTTGVEGYVGLTNNGSCRFKATTPSIKIWNRYDINSPIGLVVDDDITTLVRQNPSSGWGWTTFSGLDGSAEHSYRLIIPRGVYVYNFMAAGLNTTALAPYPVDYWQGDSITASSNITNGMAAPNYYVQYGIKAHRGWQVEAQAGATAASQGVSWKTHPGTASPTPDRIIIAFGTNDLGNAESSATWTSAITSIITQIHSDLPTKPVVWLGIFDTTFTHANRGTYNTDLSNTITAFGSSQVTYFSTDGTGVLSTTDSVHFDAAGAIALGNYLFNNLDGSAFSVTVGDSGTGVDSNSISTNTPVSVSDSASGVDVASSIAAFTKTETGTGTEGLSSSVAFTNVETATGTDSLIINITFTKADTASGVDSNSITTPVSVSDNASGVDSLTTAVAISKSDSALGAESFSTIVLLSISDNGTGVDAGGTGTFTPVSVSDTATASETINVVVSFAVIENGTGVDLSSLSARIFGIDSANGIESILTNVVVSTNDTAIGIDSFTVFTSTISTSNVYLFFIN